MSIGKALQTIVQFALQRSREKMSVLFGKSITSRLLHLQRSIKLTPTQNRAFTVKATQSNRIVDLRSDTVTQPSHSMLQTAARAPTGDDVMGEDPTVLALQEYVADLFGNRAILLQYVQSRTSNIGIRNLERRVTQRL